MTVTTEAGDLAAVSSAPATQREKVAVPGVPVTVPVARGATALDWVPAGRGARTAFRLRRMAVRGLTAPGGILLAVLLISPGVAVDLARSGTFGTPSAVAFVLAAVAAALVVRPKAVGTAAVLPPLLFAAAVSTLATLSGNNRGMREVVLDVGTTLALSAPLLFATTGGVLVLVAVRAGRLLAQRRR